MKDDNLNKKLIELNISEETFETLVNDEIESVPNNVIDFKKLDKMTDDEAILEIDKLTDENDTIIEQDYLSSLVEQKDRLVYYEIENIYRNPKSKAYKNRLLLRRSPPILIIKDDFDNEANFFLTENLTDELIDSLQQVKRAYYGFSGPTKLDMPDKFIDKIGYYAKNQPIKVIIPIILIVILVFLFN